MPPRRIPGSTTKAPAASRGLDTSQTTPATSVSLERRGTIIDHDTHSDAGYFDYTTEKVWKKPADQLDLTPEQLGEEITKFLTANNPNAPKNIARFNFKEKSYKSIPTINQEAVHLHIDGYLVHKESEEGKKQIALEKASQPVIRTDMGDGESPEGGEGSDDGPTDSAPTGGPEGESLAETTEAAKPAQRLRNQFNFSERASQTFNNPPRERGTATEPPPRHSFSATVTQWEMYDAYVNEAERTRLAKERQKHPAKGTKEDDKKTVVVVKEGDEAMYNPNTAKSLKILERMVYQNTYHDIAQDFRYWDDASDQFKEGKGSLLPLWRFRYDRSQRKRHVTSISWNHHFPDMFAIGYGSYDFLKQQGGAVCCFSLKNPEYPEFEFQTDSGVMSVDFHPQHPSLLAVGLYDGTVMVYDLQLKTKKPIVQTTVKCKKHTDPVWQVCWQQEDVAKNLNLLSISSDGRVTQWSVTKGTELSYNDITQLKLGSIKDAPAEATTDEDAALLGLAGGCCFDFNPSSDHLFVVGTEEGTIHKCSKAYSSQYLETYEGHHMSIYSVKWNPFHPRAFISCSADWTVRIWDHGLKRPIMTFDLNNAVGDVAWAPYSSTIFAAVTSEGKVYVFDLAENKYEPVCQQQVVKKSKLTKIMFNPKEPIIMVGDDKGFVTAFKLSPNLRKFPKIEDPKRFREAEVEKLEKILIFAEKSEAAAW